MTQAIIWDEEMDATLRRMRGEGRSWDTIGERIGVSRAIVKRRATVLGLPVGRLPWHQCAGRATLERGLARGRLPRPKKDRSPAAAAAEPRP